MFYNLIKENPVKASFMVPNYLTSNNDYDIKMRKLDFGIDKALLKPVEGSKTCFVSVNSLSTVLELKKGLRSKNNRNLEKKAEILLNRFSYDEKEYNSYRSSYNNVYHKPIQKNHEDNFIEAKFNCKAFPHPYDINWVNTKVIKDKYNFKRILVFIFSIIVLVFLTTPTALIQILSQNSKSAKDGLTLTWADSIPEPFKFF